MIFCLAVKTDTSEGNGVRGFSLLVEGVWCGTIWLGSSQSELSPGMRKRFIAARSQDAIQRKYDTGKPLRGLRSKWTDAWDAPEAPPPLPLAAQKLLVAPALKRLELADAADYMGYMSGQVVGRIKDERPIRDIMERMKSECLVVLKALGSQA